MPDIFDDKPDPQGGDNAQKAVASDLINYADRIDRLEDEKACLSEDIKEVFAEAKANGYDVKALRKVLALRKLDKETRAVIQLYGDRMGVFG